MATNSLIQFKYSDNVFMTALYIKSDAPVEEVIPFLFETFKKHSGYVAKRRGWNYVVANVAADIIKKYDCLTAFYNEDESKESKAISKHIISIDEQYYDLNPNEVVITDFITIKTNWNDNFSGKMVDYCKLLSKEMIDHRIGQIYEEIAYLQKELAELSQSKELS